jgi:hypothetical protein
MSELTTFNRPLNFKGLVVSQPMTPTNGEVVVDTANSDYDPSRFAAHVIQCDAPYTIEVLGPARVWASYPGQVGGLANEISIVRGRWLGIKVLTEGLVWIQSDRHGDAWAGVF